MHPPDPVGTALTRARRPQTASLCYRRRWSRTDPECARRMYIRHASLWLDLQIVAHTVWMMLFTGDRRDEQAIAAALRERAAGAIAEPRAAEESAAVGAVNIAENLRAASAHLFPDYRRRPRPHLCPALWPGPYQLRSFKSVLPHSIFSSTISDKMASAIGSNSA